ncbi:type IV secretory system conjugative DNA transfer family protein [Loktanella sp. SALINAS62]|nr:type IV secretory system conjugative DNA transfer family protein [Loktanella sp. SALINAS62]
MKMTVACLIAVICGLVAGSGIASVFLTIALGRDILATDLMLHTKTLMSGMLMQQPYLTGHLIVLAVVAFFLLIALVTVAEDRLVNYGDRRFQSKSSVRKNRMLNDPGAGFVLGEHIAPPAQHPDRPINIKANNTDPEKNKSLNTRRVRYIAALYSTVSNILLVAPTRSGKGVGFVIPNALTFPGSMVALDVKGELWVETSRARAQLGDKVFRFAPFDFKHPTHNYNPLAGVADIENMEELWTAIGRVAHLFLQSDGNQDWLDGSILLFISAGILAVQRGNATMGEIYRIIFGTGEGADIGKSSAERLLEAAKECQYPPAARQLNYTASLDAKISQSFISILSTAGLSQWANPKVERVTRTSDFDFREMRRTPMSIYLEVLSDDVKDLNSLIRLFFADLISFLRSSKPESDEPFPVFILLDEFDQLGHMPLVVQAMKQTAGHGGRFAIVTQSVPGLLSVPYTPEEVQAIESACQVKLYLAPKEDRTASEIETLLGDRTGSTKNRQKEVKTVGFGGGGVTTGTEKRPLLTKQEIRQMDPNKILIVPDSQNPILGDRIKYYESKQIRAIYEAQDKTVYPYPEADDPKRRAMTMTEVRERATKASEAQKVEIEQRDVNMTKAREPKTTVPQRRREKAPAKAKPKGKLGAAAQAALVDTMNSAQNQLRQEGGPKAA